MDTQKLHDLIDKVIGKDGPLRTPAYWMRRVLKDIVVEFTNTMLKIESNLKLLIANCLKQTPRYTYAELKELKEKRLLIPGQKYLLTDYIATVSVEERGYSGLNGVAQAPISRTLGIILTAKSQNEFFVQAQAFNYIDKSDPSTDYDIEYFFERSSLIGWCPGTLEMKSYVVINAFTNEEIELTNCSSGSNGAGLYYVGSDGESYAIHRGSLNSGTLTLGRMSDHTEVEFIIKSFEDHYRGCITRMRGLGSNVELPFDWSIKFQFSIEVNGKTVEALLDEAIDSRSRNIHVEPYFSDTNIARVQHLPRVRISSYGYHHPIYIGSDSTSIFIVQGSGICLSPMSQDVYLHGSFNINAHLNRVLALTPGVAFLGNCSRCVFENDKNNYGRIQVFDATDVSVIANRCNVVLMLPYYKDAKHISLEVKGDIGEIVFISRDSNNNIRQWNPADFVDAVAPEEQTTETTEE